MATTKLLTAEDLWEMGADGEPFELIDGELQPTVSPASPRHGRVVIQVAAPMYRHNAQHRLGAVYVGDVGFVLRRDPDTVLGPDIAFVRAERALSPADEERFSPVVPDLVVEVVSPSDRPGEVRDKVRRYLAAGVVLVWVVDPRRRTVAVYRGDHGERVLGEGQVLDGEDVFPGFRLPVAEVFG